MIRRATALFFSAIAIAMTGCPKEPVAPVTPDGASAPSASGGVWKATTSAKATEGCTQTWACDCSAMRNRVGCKIEATHDEATLGACAAESGPHSACTRCLALPPSPPCECKLTCP